MRRALLAFVYLLTVPGTPSWAALGEIRNEGSGRQVERIELPPASIGARDPEQALSNVSDAGLVLDPSGFERQVLSQSALSRPLSPEGGEGASMAGGPAATARERLGVAGQDAAKAVAAPGDARSRERADFTEPHSIRPADGDVAAVAATTGPDGSPASPSLGAARGSGSSDGKAPPPSPSLHDSKGAWAFIGGTFGAQLANKTLQATLPLLLYHASGSLLVTTWVLGGTALLDMLGVQLGGRLSDRYSAKAVLVGSSWVRAAAIGALPVLALFNSLTGIALVCAITAAIAIDAIGRGTADTARSTLTGALTGGEKKALNRLEWRYQMAFDIGGIAGPSIAGLLMVHFGASLVHWIAPAAFAAIALIYSAIPPKSAMPPSLSKSDKQSESGAASEVKAKRPVFDRWMWLALSATILLSLYVLQGILPAMYAKDVLGSDTWATWLVAAFSAGSMIGNMMFRFIPASWKLPHRWIAIGSIGTVALAAGWLSGGFWPAVAGIFLFSAINSVARLTLNVEIKSRTAGDSAGSAMSRIRLASNGTSALLRILVGLAFLGVSVSTGWMTLSAGIAVFAILQWLISRAMAPAPPPDSNLPGPTRRAWGSGVRSIAWSVGIAALGFAMARRGVSSDALAAMPILAMGTVLTGAGVLPAAGPRPSSVHGYPGRLIVVEGLDGSGKSTQLEMLKEALESNGLKVVVTRWNSSDLLSDTVKKAKKERALTPRTFAYFNAADLDDRMEKTILPALKEGAIVLSDRHFYTSLARDAVRGNDPAWLRNLYASTVRPDLTLYFKLPVKTAIQRVLGRAEARLKLSEDFEEEEHDRVLGQNFYAVGRDMNFSADDRENFEQFQTRVGTSYDGQSSEFGFKTIDATKSREAQHRIVEDRVLELLGPLSAYQKALPRAPSLFDKDPRDDSEKIRANYLHEKHGAHFYYRNMLERMQERFEQMMDLQSMPKVFLHGSPHLANLAKTARGEAMGDWDRSRFGPYGWDIVRHLVSLSFFQKKPVEGALLDAKVAKQFRKGYLHGFRHPDRPFSEARVLKDVEPKEHEVSTNALLQSGKKWVGEMRSEPLSPQDGDVETLVNDYVNRGGQQRLLDNYFIEEAGRGEGSMGLRDIFLVVLAPRDPNSKKDRILLNFKQVRSDADTRWFKNPYATQCERMLKAGELYSPGWEEMAGCARLGDVEYYVRQIPPQNAKIKGKLDKDDQKDVAYAVGTQLGRAHRLSLEEANRVFHQNFTAEDLERHLDEHFEEFLEHGATIKAEIEDAHQRYLARMKREGLLP